MSFIGMRVMGFKIIGEHHDKDGDRQGIVFRDDVGTDWILYRDASDYFIDSSYYRHPELFEGPNDWNQLGFIDKDGEWQQVGYSTDYPDKEPMAHIAQAQEEPPDPIPITEDDLRDTLDEPGDIGKVVLGQPTSIAKPPADPMYTLPPPPIPMVQDPTTGEWHTPEEIEAIRQAEAEEEARRDHALDPYRGDQQRVEEQARAEQAQGQQNPQPPPPPEQAQDPELARKWAEERGIEVPPAPPPSGGAGGSEAEQIQAQQRAEELARYEEATNPDLAKQRAEELARYEQAQGGPQNPPEPSDNNPVPQSHTNANETPNRYGQGPDLDGNGIPDEIGINPDNQQPGYPNTPSQGDDGEGIPGLGVPYQDFIPFSPMVQDPTTGQWRNAEPGEIVGAEGGDADQPSPAGGPEAGGPPSLAGDTENPDSQAQEVSPLQFGNTGNLQNAPDPNEPPPGNEEYRIQEVPPLQFGNTGNLQTAPDATLFEEDLFNPEAPGPTLSTDLFDPTAQGPTLDTGLIPDLAQNPHLAEMLNDNLDMAAALERNPGMFDQLKQDSALLAGEISDVTELESFRDASLEPEDVPEPAIVDQDVDTMS